jgi:hypothetical protein
MYECRCDKRLNFFETKDEKSACLAYTQCHWVAQGTGTPKDRDEVKKLQA